MSNYVKVAAEAGDQYLTLLAQGQEQFLKAVTASTAWTPPTPKAPTSATTADLPTPSEIVEANFAFAVKLLKQQQAFTEKLFAASTLVA